MTTHRTHWLASSRVTSVPSIICVTPSGRGQTKCGETRNFSRTRFAVTYKDSTKDYAFVNHRHHNGLNEYDTINNSLTIALPSRLSTWNSNSKHMHHSSWNWGRVDKTAQVLHWSCPLLSYYKNEWDIIPTKAMIREKFLTCRAKKLLHSPLIARCLQV